MTAFLILIIIVLVLVTGIYYTSWRNWLILRKPPPQKWLTVIERNLPFFSKLTEPEQQQLKDLIQLFIAKKKFHGCGGLVINDEIRITIAAQACLLLLNRSTGVYSRLQHILVYPDAFVSNQSQHNDDGTMDDARGGLLGESWHFGKVILSWDDVQRGVTNIHDGHNVVLHEFSHQLDSESGSANGAPLLHTNSYTAWAKILSEEFEELNADFQHHNKSVMDYYGATNPAEFFAVATETFFEKPQQLQKKHPELFGVLRKYYAVDPTGWQ